MIGWDVPELRHSAELVTSELVTNAVEHARTEIEVGVTRTGGGVRIEVCDADPHPPTLCQQLPGAVAARGRGLDLVANMAQRWGCHAGAGGKIVWALLTADGAAQDAGQSRPASSA
jgi:anti-sigma regulatory factor (Ser/Thr protein kinase)